MGLEPITTSSTLLLQEDLGIIWARSYWLHTIYSFYKSFYKSIPFSNVYVFPSQMFMLLGIILSFFYRPN